MPTKIIVINRRRYRIAPKINRKTAISKWKKSARRECIKTRRIEKARYEFWALGEDTGLECSNERCDIPHPSYFEPESDSDYGYECPVDCYAGYEYDYMWSW